MVKRATETYPYLYTAGDESPDMLGSLPGVDLSTYEIELFLERPDDTVLLKSTTNGGIIFDLYSGGTSTFHIVWAATDLQAKCGQEVQVRISTAGGKSQTYPVFLLDVAEMKVETP